MRLSVVKSCKAPKSALDRTRPPGPPGALFQHESLQARANAGMLSDEVRQVTNEKHDSAAHISTLTPLQASPVGRPARPVGPIGVAAATAAGGSAGRTKLQYLSSCGLPSSRTRKSPAFRSGTGLPCAVSHRRIHLHQVDRNPQPVFLLCHREDAAESGENERPPYLNSHGRPTYANQSSQSRALARRRCIRHLLQQK